MTEDEYYYCASCEEECDEGCGGGFWSDEDAMEIEIACPCCGDVDVQP